MFSPKIIFRIFLNSLIGLGLIYIWTRFVDFNEILKTLKTANLNIALLFFAFFLLSLIFRSFRLRYLLKDYKIDYRNILFITFLAQFLSYTIPIRAGEVAKSVYLSKTYHIPLPKSLVWIFIDRFLDFWMTLVTIALLITFVPANLPKNFSFILFSSILAFTLATIFALFFGTTVLKIMDKILSILPSQKIKNGLMQFAKSIIEGFDVLKRNPKDLIYLLILTTLPIITDATLWYITFLSLNHSIDFTKLALGNNITALSYLIPAAPGYVGSVEASVLAVFSLILGLDHNLASAAAVLYHILTAIVILVLGVVAIYNLNFDLNEVFKKISGKK